MTLTQGWGVKSPPRLTCSTLRLLLNGDGGIQKQNVKAGSFSVGCVTIRSDTLNNSVSDIESCVSATLPVTLPEGGGSPGGRSHYKKNNQSGLMELISSGL